MDVIVIIGILWQVALAIGVYSLLLYKQNALSEWASYSFVAISLAMDVVISVESIRKTAVTPLLGGYLTLIFPLALGVLFFTRFSKKLRSLSRWPSAVVIGVGAALALRTGISVNIMNQIIATVKPLTVYTPQSIFENILVFTTVLAVLIYFLFTREKVGPVTYVNKYARYMMMIAFGALFGNVVSTRLASLISMINLLLSFVFG